MIKSDYTCTACERRYDDCSADFVGESPPAKFLYESVPVWKDSDEVLCRTFEMRSFIRGNRITGFSFDPKHCANSQTTVVAITRMEEIDVTRCLEWWGMLNLYDIPKELILTNLQPPPEEILVERLDQSIYVLYCYFLELKRRRMSSLDGYFHIMEMIFNCSFDDTSI